MAQVGPRYNREGATQRAMGKVMLGIFQIFWGLWPEQGPVSVLELGLGLGLGLELSLHWACGLWGSWGWAGSRVWHVLVLELGSGAQLQVQGWHWSRAGAAAASPGAELVLGKS